MARRSARPLPTPCAVKRATIGARQRAKASTPAVAVSLGAGDVLYLDDDPGRRAIAENLGARAEALALRERKPLNFEVVVDGSCEPEALRFAVNSTLPHGMITSVAMYFDDLVGLPLRRMYAKGVTFHTSRVRARAELPGLLAHHAHGRFHPERVTTRVVPFTEAIDGALDPTPKVVWTNDWT